MVILLSIPLNNGAEYFDANHITVKMSKDEILEMLNSLQKT